MFLNFDWSIRWINLNANSIFIDILSVIVKHCCSFSICFVNSNELASSIRVCITNERASHMLEITSAEIFKFICVGISIPIVYSTSEILFLFRSFESVIMITPSFSICLVMPEHPGLLIAFSSIYSLRTISTWKLIHYGRNSEFLCISNSRVNCIETEIRRIVVMIA